MSPSLVARFWSKVDRSRPEGCWLWTSTKSRGYGRFSVNGGKVRAHRLSWEMANGRIPGGLHVLHRCDTPACVNPSHLFLGTPMSNAHDRDAKGRTRVPKARRGEESRMAKLTADQVQAIRHARAAGATNTSLARQYGVHRSAIGQIVRGLRWTHLEAA